MVFSSNVRHQNRSASVRTANRMVVIPAFSLRMPPVVNSRNRNVAAVTRSIQPRCRVLSGRIEPLEEPREAGLTADPLDRQERWQHHVAAQVGDLRQFLRARQNAGQKAQGSELLTSCCRFESFVE